MGIRTDARFKVYGLLLLLAATALSAFLVDPFGIVSVEVNEEMNNLQKQNL